MFTHVNDSVENKEPKIEEKNMIAASTITDASPKVKLSGDICKIIDINLLKPKLLNAPRSTVKTKPEKLLPYILSINKCQKIS